MVVFGATGFVGKLTAGYLADHAPKSVRVAIAGRSLPKLEAVRAELGGTAASWPLITADTGDESSVRAMARAARVVISTVGPYRAYGLPVVAACVEAGTHYCDLSGEVLFMRETIDRYHDAAARKDVRIVHACGFDSIPSDIGVMLLHDAALRDQAGDLGRTQLVVRSLKGRLSGGTFASMKGMIDEVKQQPSLRRVIGDPYALSPERSKEPQLGDESDLRGVEYDRDLGLWLGPFVMALANTRVVRRSNALLGWEYGRSFRYREVMSFGSGRTSPLLAGAVSAGLAGFAAGLAFSPSRAVLDRVLPKPGEGPSDEARRKGSFAIDMHTHTANGAHYVARIAAKGDPGYAATSVMLGESALALALDHDKLPERAGVLTPATALGMPLVERLRAAGQTFTASLSSRERASKQRGAAHV
ncbi:MAG: trans-acting enoyl reductase family protein [Candidatus Dormibacteria bacterium]